MLTLWIKTRNENAGYTVSSIEDGLKRFTKYADHWNRVQDEIREKRYSFSAHIEDQNDNTIVDKKEFKKLLKTLA